MDSPTPAKVAKISESSSPGLVTGYIHKVSPVKMARRSGARYFNAVLQTEEDFCDLVAFSPDKHMAFVDAEKNQNPVQLTDVLYETSKMDSTKQDLKFLYKSNISPVKRNVTWKYDTAYAQLEKVNHTIQAIRDKVSPYQKVSTIAKVVDRMSEPVMQQLPTGVNIAKQVFIVADATATMELTAWGSCISELEISFVFGNLRVRSFGNKKTITTTPVTTIVKHTDLEHVVEVVSHTQTPSNTIHFTGQIVQANTSHKFFCLCKKEIPHFNRGAKSIRCPSCNMRAKTSTLRQLIKTRLTLQSDFTSYKVSLSQTLLENIMPNMPTIQQGVYDTDQIEENLLDYTLTCEIQNFQIISISKFNSDGSYPLAQPERTPPTTSTVPKSPPCSPSDLSDDASILPFSPSSDM